MSWRKVLSWAIEPAIGSKWHYNSTSDSSIVWYVIDVGRAADMKRKYGNLMWGEGGTNEAITGPELDYLISQHPLDLEDDPDAEYDVFLDMLDGDTVVVVYDTQTDATGTPMFSFLETGSPRDFQSVFSPVNV